MDIQKVMVTVMMMAECAMLSASAQTREQRIKANEYKCSFSGRCLASKGGDRHTSDYGILGYSKSKSKGLDCFYSLRLNSKTQEVFTIETVFMAKQNKKTFPFAKSEMEVTLRRGFTTNIVVTSPELTLTKRKIMNGSGQATCCPGSRFYTYTYSKEGAAVVGAIGRLKKDGVIIKTYYSMAPWEKMSWQSSIDLVELHAPSSESARVFGESPTSSSCRPIKCASAYPR